jgi:hypothetical protein
MPSVNTGALAVSVFGLPNTAFLVDTSVGAGRGLAGI